MTMRNLPPGEEEREIAKGTLDQIRAELQEKEAQLLVLSTAVEQSPITIMITDPQGTIQYVNPRFESDTGFSRDEAVGKNPRMLKSGAQSAEFYRDFWEKISSGLEWTGVFHNRRKDGTLFWESATVAPVRSREGRITHYIALKSNISEQKANEDALKNSEMRLRSILDNMLEGLLTYTLDGTIESLNPSAEKMFGYRQEELAGKNLATLLPASKAKLAERYLRQARAVTSGEITESEGRRKDGTEFPFEFSLFEIDTAQGKRIAGNFRDISERTNVDRLKREFLSMVSHELRTPLTSIRGSLGLLQRGVAGEISPQAAELVEIALKNSERLVLLVNDLLDQEKLKTGKMEFHFEEVDLFSLVRNSIEANLGYGEQFKVTYRLAAGTDKILVQADPDRLQQVMANLLSNAAKFSPPGAAVDVVVSRAVQSVRVSVHNWGPEIREEFRGRIFQRFAQADSSDRRGKGGAGLGLNICKLILESMGGSIAFSSEDGAGTTFFFDLPLSNGTPSVRLEVESGERPRPPQDDLARGLWPRRWPAKRKGR